MQDKNGNTSFTKKSNVQQHCSHSAADMMVKYRRTGRVHMSLQEPFYGDFTRVPENIGDLIMQGRALQSEFDQLPSGVRARFKNNPLELVQFVHDDKNREEAIKLGLIKTETKNPVIEEIRGLREDLKAGKSQQ